MSAQESGKSPAREDQPKDARVQVTILGGGLEAVMSVYAPENGGKDVSEELIRESIARAGVVYGIDENMIKAIAEDKTCDDFIIAKGDQPVNGDDGAAAYFFERGKTGMPKILADGSADFKNIDKLVIVKEGDPLVKITRPTAGSPGMSVAGKVIVQKPGRPAHVIAGRNTEFIDDGLTLIASVNGEVSVEGGKVSVNNSFETPSGVGYESGNIKFGGSIRVTGNIDSGFSVISENGDIEISGVVDAAYVQAHGNIIVRNGIKGGDKAVIIAGGSVAAKYIEGATVKAGGDVIADAIVNSDVAARGEIIALSGHGIIVGKSVRAAKDIRVNTIGTAANVNTHVMVGIDPELHDEHQRLDKRFGEINANLEKLEQARAFLENMRLETGLDENKTQKLENLNQMMATLTLEFMEVKTALDKAAKLLRNVTNGRIHVKETAYVGTKITIGHEHYTVKSNTKYSCFYCDEEGITVGPY